LILMKNLKCFSQAKRATNFGSSYASPDWELPFEVMCDASDYALGVILSQRKDNKLYAVYYASWTLDKA